MTGRNEEIEGGRLWLRCPYCGDSSNDPTKAHLNVHLAKFLYHCYRCGASGKLTPKEALNLISKYDLDINYVEENIDKDEMLELPELILGAGSSRRSRLDRFHLVDSYNYHWDAFEIYDPRDHVVCGVHLRSSKNKLTLGDPGFSWPNASNFPLLSTPLDPITIVEGPYDVVEPRDVCLYGYPSYSRLKILKGHFIILCPDGDTWDSSGDTNLLSRFVQLVSLMMNSLNLYLMGIIYIPGGKDPDELEGNRMDHFIPRKDLFSFLAERTAVHVAI